MAPRSYRGLIVIAVALNFLGLPLRAQENTDASLELPVMGSVVPAKYPRKSRENGEEGKVMLRVLVNASGWTDQVKIQKTSGFPELDKAAVQAAESWRYQPAKRDGKPIAMWVNLPMLFKLTESGQAAPSASQRSLPPSAP